MGEYETLQFPNDKVLAQAAAVQWLDCLAGAEKAKPFLAAVSGGRIARTFFAAVATLGKPKRVLFDTVHFFWADERCVPPTDPESNYRIAYELLFEPLQIPAPQIHRIRGEEPAPVAAARAENELLAVAPVDGAGRPVFDLIFLGMGEDGHVASLFPGEPVTSREAVYRAVRATKPPPERITLSYGVISAAKRVWVLASGAGKEAALRNSLKADASTPLGKVVRERERTYILTDITLPAAAELR